MRRTLLILAAAALLAACVSALGTWTAEALYGARVQRVTPYPAPLRELTGEMGTMDGEPIDALVLPSTPVLERRDGIVFIDRSIAYPLQVRSLRSMGYGAAGALTLLGAVLFAAGRLVKKPTDATVPTGDGREPGSPS